MTPDDICFVRISALTFVAILGNGIAAAIMCETTRNTEIHETSLWDYMLGVAIIGCFGVSFAVFMTCVIRFQIPISYVCVQMTSVCLLIISIVQFYMQGSYNNLSQDQIDMYSDIDAVFMKTVEIFGDVVSWVNFSMSLVLPCIFGYYRIYYREITASDRI